MSLCMAFGGFLYAFILGWKFAFVALAMLPFLLLTIIFFTVVLQGGYKASSKAFKDSAAASEQAINAIKVVAACGQEEKEITNFERNLSRARCTGVKTHFFTAIGYAVNTCSFLFVSAYCMYLAAVFVD